MRPEQVRMRKHDLFPCSLFVAMLVETDASSYRHEVPRSDVAKRKLFCILHLKAGYAGVSKGK